MTKRKRNLEKCGERKISFPVAVYRSRILQNLSDKTSIKPPPALSLKQNLLEAGLKNTGAHNVQVTVHGRIHKNWLGMGEKWLEIEEKQLF